MSLDDSLKGKQTIMVLCSQWGDSGKGKVVDLLSQWADVIVRGTGGANAGHTVVVNGKEYIFHLIPSGITYDKEGKINILGNGMAIDVGALVNEMNMLDKLKMSYKNLYVSRDAQVVLPYHIEHDKLMNSGAGGGIGSTGRGIGPCYADETKRIGVSIGDLYKPEVLSKKLDRIAKEYPHLKIDKEKTIEDLKKYSERIKPFVTDTTALLHDLKKQGKKILIEGAQGFFLSYKFGNLPYVTSSDCSTNGTATGVSLSAKEIDLVLSLVKFPYSTRVGNGPFPTEFGGKSSEEYCDRFKDIMIEDISKYEHFSGYELEKYGISFKTEIWNGVERNIYDRHDPEIIEMINSNDSFEKGIGIRLAGFEYGATTGRPRRTGWTDLKLLEFALKINGPDVILTKPDVLQGCDEFFLGIGYENLSGYTRDTDLMRIAKPILKRFEGFEDPLSEIKTYDKLPKGLKEAMDYITQIGGNIRMISTGSDRNQNIFV